MARWYHIPKGHKSVKYSKKRPPITRANKYKRIVILLILILLTENAFIFEEEVKKSLEYLWQIDLNNLLKNMKDLAQKGMMILKEYLQ